MKKMKYLALLMVSILVITSFVACSDKTDDDNGETKEKVDETTEDIEEETEATEEATAEIKDIELKVWGPQEEQDLLKQMTESFATAHPEYNITWDYGVVAEGDAATELTKDAAEAADVFMFASDQTSALVNAGILYPVTYNVEEANAANSDASVQAT